MMKIAIVHFQPLENYPPVMNFIDYLVEKNEIETTVYSTTSQKFKFKYTSINGRIFRLANPTRFKAKLLRILSYYKFNVSTFLKLIQQGPDIVIYYESYSALPVYWYLKFFGKNKRLWIHSHEYFSPEWYEKGMKTVKLYHQKEISFLYKKAFGLSQTNKFRLEFFLKDYPFLDKERLHVLPNYPPPGWKNFNTRFDHLKYPLKIIYIGSMSLWANYLENFCQWLINEKKDIMFDIYTHNADQETIHYITNLKSEKIKLFPSGIPNKEIPCLIKSKGYQIGVILYKGLFINTAWCASDKLFEYLNCGLDVWFSQEMPGTYPYITTDTYPKVIKVDFSHMENFDLNNALSRDGLRHKPYNFNCEEIYEKMLQKLKEL